jgi:hypothetical protein
MKILEAERWLKGTNFREVAFLQRQRRRKRRGRPPSGGSEGGRAQCMRGMRRHGCHPRGSPSFKRRLSPLASSTVADRVFANMLQDPPPTTRGLGPTCHAGWPRAEEAKPPRAESVTARRLQTLLHFRPDQRVKGRTAMQVACNRTKGAHPFDFDASSMEAQAHTSCNRRAGYYVQEAAPPLAPVPRLLDRGTGAATRGNPAHGPTVTTKQIGHLSVSCRRRRDGRYGQKWAGSNGGSRRAEAAVKSSAGSRPLLEQQGNPLPRREDDAPVFRSSNGSRTRNGCPANHSSRRINSAAGHATPLAGEAGDASPPP